MNCYEFYEKYLKVIGLDNPNHKWPFWKTVKYYTRRSVILVCISYAMIFSSLDIYFRDQIIMTEIAFHAIDISIYANCLFRILYALYHNDNIHIIINKMNSFKPAADLNFEVKPLSMTVAIDRTKKLMMIWIFFATGCIAMIHMSAILEIIKPNSNRIHITPMYCYFNCTTHPMYEVTLLFEMITQQMHGISYINLDLFFFGTAILLSQQFDILSSDIKNVMYSTLVTIGIDVSHAQELKKNVENPRKVNYQDLAGPQILNVLNSTEYSKALKTNMAVCVRHHQDLLDVLRRLQNVISLSSFFQCIFSTGYLMFSLFALVVYDDTAVKMNAIAYLYGSTVQISCMCLVGQLLSNKFDKLRQAVTEMPWYLINDRNFSLTNVILLIKLNVPYKVAAGKFFDLSHEMLIQIYRTAFTYFTVLREITTI